jgi:hypothetical protein
MRRTSTFDGHGTSFAGRQNQTHTFANGDSPRYQLEFCEGAYHPVEIALAERG